MFTTELNLTTRNAPAPGAPKVPAVSTPFWRAPRLFRRSILCFFVVVLGCRSNPDSLVRHLTPVQVADRAKPATVWIIVTLEATVEVPALRIDETALAISAESQMSQNFSVSERFRTLMKVLLEEPGKYYVPTRVKRSKTTTIHSQGSGLIFTPDGYIATNAHVVAPDRDDLKMAFINSVVEWVDSDVDELEGAINRSLHSDVSDEDRRHLRRILAEYYGREGNFSDLSRDISVVLGYTSAGNDLALVRAPATVAKIGEPTPGKDVAILKMDGTDLPTLPLATSIQKAGLRTGSEIDVMGFPGAITTATELSLPSRLEPSQTTGHVSAIKDMNGMKVIQTDTAINPGNSGGPALNDKGEVIGLATFKLEDQQNINFIIGVDVLQEFVLQLGIQPHGSQFTQKYIQALDAYDQGKRAHALDLFRQLQNEHHGIRQVEDFVSELDRRPPTRVEKVAQNVQEVRPSPSPRQVRESPPRSRRSHVPLLVFAVVGGVLGLLVVVLMLANRT